MPVALRFGVRINDSATSTKITEESLKALTADTEINVSYSKGGPYPNALYYNAPYERIQWGGDMNNYERIALNATPTGDFEISVDIERYKANADTGIAINLTDSNGNDLEFVVGPNYIACQKEWARQNGNGWNSAYVISLNGVNGWTTNVGTQTDGVWKYTLKITVTGGVVTFYIDGYNCGSFTISDVYPAFNTSGKMSVWLATKDTDFGSGGYIYFKNIDVKDDVEQN